MPTSEFPPNREHLKAHSAVSRNGLPYRCLSFEDRSSSDKTLPRYSVRAFLYSAMIRGFSFGPASAYSVVMPLTIWRAIFAASRAFSLVSDESFARKAFAIATRKALRAAGSQENRIGAASNGR